MPSTQSLACLPYDAKLLSSPSLADTIGLRKRPRRHETPVLPTQALPGTREKVTVLAQRARMGVSLWHPDDARLEQPRNIRAAV